ncbi:MAG: AAA-like domain-containing protein, partial [Waterburya sp.]
AAPANGCPNIDGAGAGKFEKLRIWLQEKYSDWLPGYSFIPLNPYYIERSPVESDCYQELLQPGAFVRIKAPRQMGKTWLLEQILRGLRRKGYQTVHYNFGLEEGEVFNDYAQFTQSFAAGVTHLLDLPDCLDKYWSKNLGSNQNSTKYFEKYLLQTCNKPLILALDQVDSVFKHEKIAVDFCKLLRGWHEKAKQGDRLGAIWRQLRLVVVHSTDVYSDLNINSSPLAGVGKVVTLRQFTAKQVQELAKRYQLQPKLKEEQIEELMSMIGGHPNLVTESFEYLTNSQVKVSWQEFLQFAPTDAPPFGNHLRQLLWTLKQHPELATAFSETISSSQPVNLPADSGFKLHSMGLVNME